MSIERIILVPTPIGNLADMTRRAVEVLTTADVVAAEDTRHSGQLLRHLGLERPLLRLDAHTIASRAPRLLEQEEGSLAFMTDAGTPGISDPGAELVRLALQRDIAVEALPGPTAFVPALVLSGLDTARFTFEGFLPRKGSARNERLARIGRSDATSLLYESPHRVAATLADLAAVCGPERQASVSRELSKRFEETVRGGLGVLAEKFSDGEVRGEFVICVAASPEPAADAAAADLQALAAQLKATGLERKDLRTALELAGASRNQAYELSLTAGRNQLK